MNKLDIIKLIINRFKPCAPISLNYVFKKRIEPNCGEIRSVSLPLIQRIKYLLKDVA